MFKTIKCIWIICLLSKINNNICDEFKDHKIYQKKIILKIKNTGNNDNYEFSFCKRNIKCSEDDKINFWYNQTKDKCIKDMNINKFNLPHPDNDNIKDKINIKNLKIIYTVDKNYYYKLNVLNKDNYEILLPYKPNINNVIFYISNILKIIIGFYLCFFGIHNYKLTILLISYLFLNEIFEITIIFIFNEEVFYLKSVFIPIVFWSIIIGFWISFLTYRYEKFKIIINSIFFSFVWTKFLFISILSLFWKYLGYFILVVSLVFFIFSLIISNFYVKNDVINVIMIYTSFIGSFYVIYFLRKLTHNKESIFQIIKDIFYYQDREIINSSLIFAYLLIVFIFIFGFLTQNQMKKKIFKKLTDSNMVIKTD